ncbi:PPA1309 family protein [Nocardioides sp. BP30]|uniref:PPA1309 family protein n=1 Tax=Nocardioides sp. BP30 TaxID=3036374 RepID=UPI002469A1B7|nr:PPA1309 family protein [Nocardioides sp. BP30]WGL51433.1 PPA1309 family protein [Nocardioides sp. BP30]
MSEYDEQRDNELEGLDGFTGELDDDLDTDPALAAAVLEIEEHAAGEGWDRPARLYALVDTAALVAQEPALASLMGLDEASAQGSLTPIEQDQLAPEVQLEDVLPTLVWPEGVVGCAAVVERLVLPPDASGEIPEDPAAAAAFAASHPARQEVRITAGVTRAGATYSALRLRSHDDAASVAAGADLVPQLTQLLASTLESDA